MNGREKSQFCIRPLPNNLNHIPLVSSNESGFTYSCISSFDDRSISVCHVVSMTVLVSARAGLSNPFSTSSTIDIEKSKTCVNNCAMTILGSGVPFGSSQSVGRRVFDTFSLYMDLIIKRQQLTFKKARESAYDILF